MQAGVGETQEGEVDWGREDASEGSGAVIDWLIGWLVDWLIGWLVDWLVDWLIGWLINVFQTSLDRAIRARIEQIESLSKDEHDKLDKIVQKQAILNHIVPKITQADKGNLPPSMRDVVMMNVQKMNENMKDGPGTLENLKI